MLKEVLLVCPHMTFNAVIFLFHEQSPTHFAVKDQQIKICELFVFWMLNLDR